MNSAFVLTLALLAAGQPQPEQTAAKPQQHELEYLVPELKDAGYKLDEGPREFKQRFALSPAAGKVGSSTLFALRLAYNPYRWLGWEAAVSHTSGDGLHALFHTLSAQLRYPVSWRLQPYGVAGYGMFLVYPGNALNASPATRNALSYGGGAEFYIRNDLALRGEMRGVTILGTQKDLPGTVAYNYREMSLGFVFYRTLLPGD